MTHISNVHQIKWSKDEFTSGEASAERKQTLREQFTPQFIRVLKTANNIKESITGMHIASICRHNKMWASLKSGKVVEITLTNEVKALADKVFDTCFTSGNPSPAGAAPRPASLADNMNDLKNLKVGTGETKGPKETAPEKLTTTEPTPHKTVIGETQTSVEIKSQPSTTISTQTDKKNHDNTFSRVKPRSDNNKPRLKYRKKRSKPKPPMAVHSQKKQQNQAVYNDKPETSKQNNTLHSTASNETPGMETCKQPPLQFVASYSNENKSLNELKVVKISRVDSENDFMIGDFFVNNPPKAQPTYSVDDSSLPLHPTASILRSRTEKSRSSQTKLNKTIERLAATPPCSPREAFLEPDAPVSDPIIPVTKENSPNIPTPQSPNLFIKSNGSKQPKHDNDLIVEDYPEKVTTLNPLYNINLNSLSQKHDSPAPPSLDHFTSFASQTPNNEGGDKYLKYSALEPTCSPKDTDNRLFSPPIQPSTESPQQNEKSADLPQTQTNTPPEQPVNLIVTDFDSDDDGIDCKGPLTSEPTQRSEEALDKIFLEFLKNTSEVEFLKNFSINTTNKPEITSISKSLESLKNLPLKDYERIPKDVLTKTRAQFHDKEAETLIINLTHELARQNQNEKVDKQSIVNGLCLLHHLIFPVIKQTSNDRKTESAELTTVIDLINSTYSAINKTSTKPTTSHSVQPKLKNQQQRTNDQQLTQFAWN